MDAAETATDGLCPKRPPARATIGLLLAVVLAAAGCTSTTYQDESKIDGPTIRIASFDFDENVLLGEIYRQALRAKGFNAQLKAPHLDRAQLINRVEAGDLDFVADYLGAAIVTFSRGAVTDPSPRTRQAREQLRTVIEPLGLTRLASASAQDRETLVVTVETSEENDLTRMSQLERLAPGWILGGPPACPDEERCLSGLERVYGLDFEEFVAFETARELAEALVADRVQVGIMQSSAAEIPAFDLKRLTDNKRRVPAQNVTPIIRSATLERGGAELRDAVNAVSAALTTDELAELNARVSIAGEAVDIVATEFLAGEDLL